MCALCRITKYTLALKAKKNGICVLIPLRLLNGLRYSWKSWHFPNIILGIPKVSQLHLERVHFSKMHVNPGTQVLRPGATVGHPQYFRHIC